MLTIEVVLGSDRNRVGRLVLKDGAGRTVAGPYSVCGRANDFAASEHGNPTRSALQHYGDTPTGEYQMRAIVRTGRGSAYDAAVFGKFGMITLVPVRGQAALADQNGRHVLVIHAGTPNPASKLLYATNGSLRMFDEDLRDLIEALRGESSAICRIVETNEFATSLSVTLDPTFDEGDPPLLATDLPKVIAVPSAEVHASLTSSKVREHLVSPRDEAYSSSGDGSSDSSGGDSSSGDSSGDSSSGDSSGDSSSSDSSGDSSSSDSSGDSSSGDSSGDSSSSSSSGSGGSGGSGGGSGGSGDGSSSSGSSSSSACSITGITPTNASLFAGEPQLFAAQGKNLDSVTWSTSASANPATGSGPQFTTRWSATGNQTVTATCGGVSKSVTVKVHSLDIQINNTTATNDDLVVLNSTHPVHQFNVNCQMRLVGPSVGNVTVVLANPDGRLRFPNPGDTTVSLTLDAGGAFSAFQISGAAASAAMNDAVIHIHKDTATGSEITTKNVTVVSFDLAAVPLTQGGNYSFVGTVYQPAGAAVSFTSSARIRPAGVDCTAPQLTNLRIAIMQECSIKLINTTWDTPTIAWLAAATTGTTVTVPTTTRRTVTYDPSVVQPVNDGLDGAYPLYDKSATALTPATGCSGSGTAASNDAPQHSASLTFSQTQNDSAGVAVATVTWSNRVNTTRVQHFRTFCVVFDSTNPTPDDSFFSLREAIWDINLDSAAAAQHATVNADGAATANPATGVQSNHAPLTTTDNPVGAATTTFTK